MRKPNGYPKAYWFRMSRSQRVNWKAHALGALAQDFGLIMNLQRCVDGLKRKNKFLQEVMWRAMGLKDVT